MISKENAGRLVFSKISVTRKSWSFVNAINVIQLTEIDQLFAAGYLLSSQLQWCECGHVRHG